MSLLPDLMEPPPTPYDLGQTPADVVVISALPADLAALSEARTAWPDAPSLRLVNLAHLQHPASVDQHLDSCATHARLVIVRLPDGGESWPYGLAQYTARCAGASVPLALLPSGPNPEPELQQQSTVSEQDAQALQACLDEGGPESARRFLHYCQAMLGRAERPALPQPLPHTGLYWPGSGACTLAQVESGWQPGRPTAALLFPRALVHGAGLHPVNRTIRALLRASLNPLPVFTGGVSEAEEVQALLSLASPAVILSCLPGSEASALTAGTPVLHAAMATFSEADWIESANGLPPRDIAEHVLLPARDGQIFTRAISTTDEAFFDEETQCPILTPRALGDRIEFTAQLAANWARLLQMPRTGRKLALVSDAREQDPAGMAQPLLHALQGAGYSVSDMPDARSSLSEIVLPLEAYRQAFAALPWPLRDAVEQHWGAPEDDPAASQSSGFRLPIQRCGNVVLARSFDTEASMPPPHTLLALHVWLRQVFGADAMVHLGGHGGLGTLPGKALALNAESWPEQMLGPVPHIALFASPDAPEVSLTRNRLHALCLPLEGAALIGALDGSTSAPAPCVPALPSAEAWRKGQADAETWVEDYLQAHGDWPRAASVTFRAVPTALSEGADIARALALMGVKPGEQGADGAAPTLSAAPSPARPPVAITPRFSACFLRSFPELAALIEAACKGR